MTCHASSRRYWWSTATRTGWCPAATPSTWLGGCRTANSSSTPTPDTAERSSTTTPSWHGYCTSSKATDANNTTGPGTVMKAFTIDKYGSNDNVRAVQVPDPQLRDDDVLVEIHAASVNPLDARIRDGKVKPILPYRLPLILGNDLAGVVVRVGSAVRRFQPGDQVYARPAQDRIGTFAELISINQNDVALKPARLTMQEAASLPLVALTAWQALDERADLRRGQKVLIHAGSGGL